VPTQQHTPQQNVYRVSADADADTSQHNFSIMLYI
jgi:hypothetical protein